MWLYRWQGALIGSNGGKLSAPLETGYGSVCACEEGDCTLNPSIYLVASLFSIFAGFRVWRWWWNSFNNDIHGTITRLFAFVGIGILWVAGAFGILTRSVQF
jgi:hypothetical protein